MSTLGVSSQERFPDSQFSASYSLDDTNAVGRPEHAILNNNQGSWCAYYQRADEWLELDLGSDQTIYGVLVQGSHDSDSKVTEYIISLRVDSASAGTWLFQKVCILKRSATHGHMVQNPLWFTAKKIVTVSKKLALAQPFKINVSLYWKSHLTGFSRRPIIV